MPGVLREDPPGPERQLYDTGSLREYVQLGGLIVGVCFIQRSGDLAVDDPLGGVFLLVDFVRVVVVFGVEQRDVG